MAQTFNSKVEQVALAYKRLLKIKVTDTSFRRNIEENPFYPSLLCISDTFDRYNTPNAAYRVSRDEFDEMSAPFIAFVYLPNVGDDFVLVTQVTDDTVSYIYDKNRPVTLEKKLFIDRFKNTAFLAQPNENSEEDNYVNQLRKEQKANNKKRIWITTIAVMLFSMVILSIPAEHVLSYSIITIAKLIGLTCAGLLLAYEIDKSNVFVKNICSATAKTSCAAVLESKMAKISGITWSEIGGFYFLFTSLILLTPGIPFLHKVTWLSLLNAVAVPYVLFSIYYQWRVIKQWCPLCLVIQSVLIIELIWSITSFWLPYRSLSILTTSTINEIFQVLFFGLFPLVSWYGLKPYFLKAKNHNLYRSAYRRLQYNPDLFNGLLVQQPKVADQWQSLGIDLGNSDAPNTIIKVCSPFCDPCAKTHPKLEEVITKNKNVKLKIIFTATNHENDIAAPVVRHLLAIASQGNILNTRQALDDWYSLEVKNYKALASKYPLNGELKLQDGKIEAMSTWCSLASVVSTPTIYVNGHLLPENYSVEDLTYLL